MITDSGMAKTLMFESPFYWKCSLTVQVNSSASTPCINYSSTLNVFRNENKKSKDNDKIHKKILNQTF